MENDNPLYEEVEVSEFQPQKNDCYKSLEELPDVKGKNLVSEKHGNKKAVLILVLIFAVLVLLLGAVAGTTAYALHELSEIKSEIATTNQAVLQHSSACSSMVVSAQMNVSLEVMMYQQLVRDLEDRIQQLQDSSNDTAEVVAALDDRITQVQTSSNQQYSTIQALNNSATEIAAALDSRLIQVAQQSSFAISTLQQQSAQNDSTFNTTLTHLLSSSTTIHQQLTNSIFTIFSTLDVNISTCDELPESLSAGYYDLVSYTGSAVRQYCPSITTRCGQTGRWRSVANLDMTNSTHQCFSGLRQTDYSGKRLCARISDSPKCSSVLFPTDYPFNSVCGLVRGYQYATTDGIQLRSISDPNPYVDGVSITHGSPRQHIWTFAATRSEDSGRHGCPCMGGSNSRPAFVGNDYFCDTGTSTAGDGYVFYGDDPLWDGAGCGPTNNCCSFNTPPWFYKELPQYTDNDIELRVCCDGNLRDEDIALEAITIYVK